MNSPVDHGYGSNCTIRVRAELVVRHASAEGIHQLRVVKWHSADRGKNYWLCAWVDGPRAPGCWIREESAILADAYAA